LTRETQRTVLERRVRGHGDGACLWDACVALDEA
jgi:hypothetical protein